MLQHTNRTNLQRESWLENQHTISAACDTAEQLPHLQRVVMYTPPFFFFLATAYSYTFSAGNSSPIQLLRFHSIRIPKWKVPTTNKIKVMWLKAGCGAPPIMCPGTPSNTSPLTPKATPKSQMVRKLLYLQWPIMNTIKDSIFLVKL